MEAKPTEKPLTLMSWKKASSFIIGPPCLKVEAVRASLKPADKANYQE